MYPYILTDSMITMVIDDKQYTINSNNSNFGAVLIKIKTDDIVGLLYLMSYKAKIEGYIVGNMTLGLDDKLYYKDTLIDNVLTDKILTMSKLKLPIDSMLRFLDNLMLNPSEDSISELYDFLSHGKMPITSDGHFLAYKKVTKDFKDCYTGTIDNSVGSIVKMDRTDVNDNRNDTCSTGLHFCSFDYLSVYRTDLPTLILKINPKDVVSIPSDYNNTKGRCCEYTVFAEYEDSHKPLFDKVVVKDEDIVVMNSKQQIVYKYLSRYILVYFNQSLPDVDLVNLRLDYKSHYSDIIEHIMDIFDKPISRSTALKYYQFMKTNFGIH